MLAIKLQPDLFNTSADVAEFEASNDAAPRPEPIAAEPMAVPCGFIDRLNRRCSRLATRPVMFDGRQMICRSHPMLHCDLACFNAPRQHSSQDENKQ